jgi:hypothetical protein
LFEFTLKGDSKLRLQIYYFFIIQEEILRFEAKNQKKSKIILLVGFKRFSVSLYVTNCEKAVIFVTASKSRQLPT